MIINGVTMPTLAVFPTMMTVPDCVVVGSNKLGRGHGEAKFYISSKEEMRDFYGAEGFEAKCFMLKADLIAYMKAIRNEYMTPSQDYARRDDLPVLWEERMNKIKGLPEIVTFSIYDQTQIEGPRGYVNSDDNGYFLLRTIALPLVSYVYVEKIGSEKDPVFYWKLFVDFDAIWERQNGPLVFTYGRRTEDKPLALEENTHEVPPTSIRRYRQGQERYRAALLEQCRFCPFTMISDERLLVASHIKPWAASSEEERIDPFNGYILSPMYDWLFDKGFITFTKNRRVVLSEFISPYTWKRIGLSNNQFINALPMDEKRAMYLEFHHDAIFKGSFSSKESTYSYVDDIVSQVADNNLR